MKNLRSDLVYDYDDDADVLRINNKDCLPKDKKQIDSSEVYPGIWVVFIMGDERCFLTIEILKAKRRDLKPVNDFLEENYNITIKEPIA